MEYGELAKFTFDWIGREIDPERWCYHSLVHTRAVVEDGFAFHFAEDLMLVGDDEFYINLRRTVKNRLKNCLEPSVT